MGNPKFRYAFSWSLRKQPPHGLTTPSSVYLGPRFWTDLTTPRVPLDVGGTKGTFRLVSPHEPQRVGPLWPPGSKPPRALLS